jgi:exodeoxyribonuclease VII large subunit
MYLDYKKILTVSELTQQIKQRLEEGFREIWVEGELSNLRSPSSGHYYFTLKDDKSQMRAVIFRFMGRFLKFALQDGLSVICRGRVTVYEPRGEYQLILDYIEPKGIGALQLAFEQLKEKLKREGLFDPAHKKPLPLLPKKIGIVTSPSGAAIQDLLQVIGRRFPTVEILINPVRVQGEGAAQEIATAIEELNRVSGIDVIIVARGGGSLEDLWAFNEEVVARAIFRSAIPTISAVGHEIDFTIADFVADLRAPTPSVAGELVVRDKAELTHLIGSLSDRLGNAMIHQLEGGKKQLTFLKKSVPDLRLIVGDLQLRVDDLSSRLVPRVTHGLQLKRERLKGMRLRLLLRNPALLIKDCRKTISLCEKGLVDSTRQCIDHARQLIERDVGKLSSLSPLQVLQRGYSITRKLPSYQIVKESGTLSEGERVNVVLGKGELFCQVEKITH